ncbi:RluA family pseudouridine synthase [Kordiimonas sediminis]|uniref:RluA family pseudouridine synthase n=1 Tax=Kordiimonas sediminis TaxID=1735581 RepID=UPI00174AC735
MSSVYTPPLDPYLDILFEDDSLLVLNKQSGLLSVPGRTDDRKDSLQLRAQDHTGGALTVHRLDMETSGVIVMAKSKDSHRALSRQFQDRKTDKDYVAVVAGRIEQDRGTIDLPMRCDWPNRPKQIIDHELGKSAQTQYQVVERHDDRTRVKLTPITGRSHQLRVHMLALGHPILGDALYATGEALAASKRLLLHAERLTITHPVTEERCQFFAPVPF